MALADAGGCRITGADGALRVSLGGAVRAVPDERGWLATSSGETLAVQVILQPDDIRSPTVLRLGEPGSPPQDVDLGGRHVAGIRLGLDGTVVVGPEVADDAHGCSLTGGRSPVLARALEAAGDHGIDIAGGASTVRQALVDGVGSFPFEPAELVHSPLGTHVRHHRRTTGRSGSAGAPAPAPGTLAAHGHRPVRPGARRR